MNYSMRPDYPSLVGTLVADKYRIDHLLGQGGMGLVYAATHLDLARRVALKLIRRELMETESVAERFLREARAAARIQSEHVGRVLDVGRLETGEPYIVMEFLEGQDLAAHLEQFGPFTWSVAVDMILEACEAIAEAHRNQIVHRDLKPENLFLVKQIDGSLLVKVLDFGISKQLGDNQRVLTSPSTAIGSPQYMAPEQMEGQDVDVRADVWALGAILYEMVTGTRAFQGETLAAVCVHVLSGTITPVRSLVPEVPSPLALAIETCLRPPRAERFGSVAGFASGIAPFGSDRARLSTQRIHAVLGYTGSQSSTGTAEWKGPAFEGTLIQGAKGTASGAHAPVQTSPNFGGPPMDLNRRTALEPGSRVPATTDGALSPASHTLGTVDKRSLVPVFAGLIAVVAIGIGLWMFTRNYAEEEKARIKAAADLAAAYSAVNAPAQFTATAAAVLSTQAVAVAAASPTAAASTQTTSVWQAESTSAQTTRVSEPSSIAVPSNFAGTKPPPRQKPQLGGRVAPPNTVTTQPAATPTAKNPLQPPFDVNGFGGRK
jgi:eukaryotic-like serine/threonine-protein kinase